MLDVPVPSGEREIDRSRVLLACMCKGQSSGLVTQGTVVPKRGFMTEHAFFYTRAACLRSELHPTPKMVRLWLVALVVFLSHRGRVIQSVEAQYPPLPAVVTNGKCCAVVYTKPAKTKTSAKCYLNVTPVASAHLRGTHRRADAT